MLEIKMLKKYITKKKKQTRALKGVLFQLPDRGLYFLLGKRGCGKSTLLSIIGGIEKATSGEVIVGGKAFRFFRKKWTRIEQATSVLYFKILS